MADFRVLDKKGLTICPNCKKHYKPELGERKPDLMVIKQYPLSTEEQRQQLISGLCSNKCYQEYTRKSCWADRLDKKRMPDDCKKLLRKDLKIAELKKLMLSKGIASNPDQARSMIFRWLAKGEIHRAGPGIYNFLVSIKKKGYELIDDISILPIKVKDFLIIPRRIFKMKSFLIKKYFMRRTEAKSTIKLWIDIGLINKHGRYVGLGKRLIDKNIIKFISSKPVKKAEIKILIMKKYFVGVREADNLIKEAISLKEVYVQSENKRNPFIGLDDKLLAINVIKNLSKDPVVAIELKRLLMKKYSLKKRGAEEIIATWINHDKIERISSHILIKK